MPLGASLSPSPSYRSTRAVTNSTKSGRFAVLIGARPSLLPSNLAHIGVPSIVTIIFMQFCLAALRLLSTVPHLYSLGVTFSGSTTSQLTELRSQALFEFW